MPIADVVSQLGTIATVAIAVTGVGVVAFLRGLIKATREQGVKEDRRDRATDFVLGDDDKPGLVQTFPKMRDQLDDIKRELRPNSGKSLADAVNRVERAVNDVKATVAEHVGEEREARRQIRRELDRKVDKT